MKRLNKTTRSNFITYGGVIIAFVILQGIMAGGGLSAAENAGGEGGTYAVGALFEKGKAPRRIEGDLAGQLIARAREIAKEREGKME